MYESSTDINIVMKWRLTCKSVTQAAQRNDFFIPMIVC